MKFCPYCGTPLQVEGGIFCHQCGEGLPVAVVAPIARAEIPAAATDETPRQPGLAITAKAKPLSPWFWLGCVCLVALLASYLSQVTSSEPALRNSRSFVALDVILLMGFMNAYLRRRVGRSGWAGFALGLLVGIAFIWAFATAIGGARYMGHLARPAAQGPATKEPNVFDQFDPKRDIHPLDIQPLEKPAGALKEPWIDTPKQ